MIYIKRVPGQLPIDPVTNLPDTSVTVPDMVLIAGTVANQQMLDDGYVEYTGAVPEGDLFTWDDVNGVIVGDLTPTKTNKILELASKMEEANYADVAYMNTTFQADKRSQDLIVAALSAGSVPAGFYWKDTANNNVAMTYADLQGLATALLARAQANFDKLQTHKATIATLTARADIEAVVW